MEPETVRDSMTVNDDLKICEIGPDIGTETGNVN